MKTIFAVSIMGMAVAIAMGIVGVNAVSDSEIPTLSSSGLGILGHATVIVTDSDGNIVQYKQTDNAIITTGKDCVARFLFDNATAEPSGSNCKNSQLSSGFTGFNYIGVSNITGVTTLDSSATIGTNFNPSNEDMATSGALPRVQDTTVEFTVASGASTGATASLSTGPMAITDAVGSTNVTTSALFDDGTVGSDIAAAIIAIPNGVSVTAGDSLTVNWTVTVG